VTFTVTLILCIDCWTLDYSEIGGIFRHPERRVIFVGDFIDRGPEQREVLRIAHSMCEAGSASAVLGNHEFNAIGWAAQNDDGGFFRNHSEKKMRTNTQSFFVSSRRTHLTIRMQFAGFEAYPPSWPRRASPRRAVFHIPPLR
jgi:Calcineurin-like phosphoesterase